eukprot:GILJ01017296.1.p1 GENE.GILJ01017296.1~~GILJ01017296.1.p1  ORF type:complete len:545 (+),score=64.48 GILJ01017296.1:241-1635(+)
MVEWGMNVARLGIHWHRYEIRPYVYNNTYLDDVTTVVNQFERKGIYVILDMHQDNWSPYFCNGHGIPSFYAHPYNTSDYAMNGKKAYPLPIAHPKYNPDGSISNCQDIKNFKLSGGFSYPTFAMGAAVQRLYDNEDGILDNFAIFWQLFADRFKTSAAVLGYELINEPWIGNAPLQPSDMLPNKPHWNLWWPGQPEKQNLQRMNAYLHKKIRQVDDKKIIFFQPPTGGNYVGMFRTGYTEGPGGRSYNDRQAYAYHHYCDLVTEKNDRKPSSAISWWQKVKEGLGRKGCELYNGFELRNRRHDTNKLGVAAIMTEFGSMPNTTAGIEMLDWTADRLDEMFHGWVYWKIPLKQEQPFNKIRALARTYAQTVAGTPTLMRFNAKTGHFTLKYKPAIHGTTFSLPTEIYASQKYYYPTGLNYQIQPQGIASASYNVSNNILSVSLLEAARTVPEITIRIVPTGHTFL